MANLQTDQDDESLPQPIALDSNSTPKQRADANRQHHQQLISHTLDAATYNAHGHAVGK
jgi:hypothetical protein